MKKAKRREIDGINTQGGAECNRNRPYSCLEIEYSANATDFQRELT